jgi:hypothetical protein
MKPVHPQYKVSQIGITTKDDSLHSSDSIGALSKTVAPGKGVLSAPIPDEAKEPQTMWNTRPVEPVRKGLLL